MSTEPCPDCLFVADDYSPRDLRTAARWLTTMLHHTLEPIDDAALAAAEASRREAEAAIAALGPSEPDTPDAPVAPDTPDLVHAGIHAVSDVGRALAAAGAVPDTRDGRVLALHVSDGGVPKTPVASFEVGRRGATGDRQANRKHHGRPFQALCLWSAETIDALAAEGHPIRAGAAGENITVAGLDWSTVRPGLRVRVGSALVELSGWAEPCRKNDQWFTGRSDRIDHAHHPGWSRIYAWVLEPGHVAVDDDVIVEPPA